MPEEYALRALETLRDTRWDTVKRLTPFIMRRVNHYWNLFHDSRPLPDEFLYVDRMAPKRPNYDSRHEWNMMQTLSAQSLQNQHLLSKAGREKDGTYASPAVSSRFGPGFGGSNNFGELPLAQDASLWAGALQFGANNKFHEGLSMTENASATFGGGQHPREPPLPPGHGLHAALMRFSGPVGTKFHDATSTAENSAIASTTFSGVKGSFPSSLNLGTPSGGEHSKMSAWSSDLGDNGSVGQWGTVHAQLENLHEELSSDPRAARPHPAGQPAPVSAPVSAADGGQCPRCWPTILHLGALVRQGVLPANALVSLVHSSHEPGRPGGACVCGVLAEGVPAPPAEPSQEPSRMPFDGHEGLPPAGEGQRSVPNGPGAGQEEHARARHPPVGSGPLTAARNVERSQTPISLQDAATAYHRGGAPGFPGAPQHQRPAARPPTGPQASASLQYLASQVGGDAVDALDLSALAHYLNPPEDGEDAGRAPARLQSSV